VNEEVLVRVCDDGGDRYRFGFNGQEKVNEISGMGNFLEFKYRIHDARLGRFMSVDPLCAQYPWNSTYAFAENRVIDKIELEGLEGMDYKVAMYESQKAMVKALDNGDTYT